MYSCLPQSKLAEKLSKPAWASGTAELAKTRLCLNRGFSPKCAFQNGDEAKCIWGMLAWTMWSRSHSCRAFRYQCTWQSPEVPSTRCLLGLFDWRTVFQEPSQVMNVFWITFWGKQAAPPTSSLSLGYWDFPILPPSSLFYLLLSIGNILFLVFQTYLCLFFPSSFVGIISSLPHPCLFVSSSFPSLARVSFSP